MTATDLENTVNTAWDDRDAVNAQTTGAVREAVEDALNMLDSGQACW
mgnify:FL=1